MAKRQAKNEDNLDKDSLFVFGYSCKLFRDDEKALYIDNGKHLIPWMGEDSLKIDRYDARGTLSDLRLAEVPSGGFDRFAGLSNTEKEVELLCDVERYRSLFSNDEEEAMYTEEEEKRKEVSEQPDAKTYSQVQFSYDETENPVKTYERTEDSTPFKPSPQLDIPVNMLLPETMKHNAIIEKTALFIAKQGPQMEILLKMKQSNNPQFNFLSFDNPLHAYYRLVLGAIKVGRYQPDTADDSNDEDSDNHYLHPALLSSFKVGAAPTIPSIQYKPSANCAYSMLVNKLKEKTTKTNNSECSVTTNASVESDVNLSPIDKDMDKSNSVDQLNKSIPPPPDTQIIIDKMASYVAKNGRDFEQIVRGKRDPRFQFLEDTHTHHAYYLFKLVFYENLNKQLEDKLKDDEKKGSPQVKLKTKTSPVSFSIKPKEVEVPIEKTKLKLAESSDEDEPPTNPSSDNVSVAKTSPPASINSSTNKTSPPLRKPVTVKKTSSPVTKLLSTTKTSVPVIKTISSRLTPPKITTALSPTAVTSPPPLQTSPSTPPPPPTTPPPPKISQSQLTSQSSNIEDVTCIDLTNDLTDEEIILEEEKLDSQNVNPENANAIKLDRKRRAALFLSKVLPKTKPDSDSDVQSLPITSSGSEKADNKKRHRSRSSSESSVHSPSRSRPRRKDVKKHKKRKYKKYKHARKHKKRSKSSKKHTTRSSSESDVTYDDSSYSN